MNINPPGGQGEPVAQTTDEAVVDIRRLSEAQLQQLGVSQLAYVKPIFLNGARAYAIHAADGTPMAVAGDRDVALAAIRQHELIPALVN